MDQHDSNNRLPEIIDYLKANPSLPAPGTGLPVGEGSGGQHVHIHYHAAPPAPPPVERKPTVAEQVIPWMWLALGAMIIGTICAMILAVVMTALLIGLIGVAVAAAALAYLIKTTRESQINLELTRQGAAPRRRNR